MPGPPRPDPEELRERFEAAHEQRYGYRDPEAEVELVDIRLAMVAPGPEPRPVAAPSEAGLARSSRRARFGGEWVGAQVLRGEPPAGTAAAGPAIFELPETTLVLPPGWAAERRSGRDDRRQARMSLDPISLQVLIGSLHAACEEMGAVLIRASHSANIKERRDCSTALFDAAGELVMQAEHIPVHLGSMPDAVAAVIGLELRPGVSWILNDPFRGGTHLPDITLISPVFAGDALIGFAAARAHHADVGGPTPGGMPADSTELSEEGVVIAPTEADEETLMALASQMRNPSQRLADLRAQRAANRVGETRLGELAESLGAEALAEGTREILAYSERRTRAALAELPDGTYDAADVLEDDARGEARDLSLRLRATVSGEELLLDFEGTDPQSAGNLNCPLPVTRSAALFAVRVLTDPDAPALGRGLQAGRDPRARGLPAERPPAGRGRRRQRRDLEPRRRPGAGGAGAGARGTRPGAGHDEQPDALLGGLHLLRDDRRRAGRLPGRRRAERDPRGDVEHAQHSGRGARVRVPAQGEGAGAAPRQRRGRVRAPRRGRDRPRDRGPGADALHADHRAAPPSPAGPRGRGRRQPRA